MTDKKTLANVLAGTGIITSLFTTGLAGIKAFASKNDEIKVPDIITAMPSPSATVIPSSNVVDDRVEMVVEDEEEVHDVLAEPSAIASASPSVSPIPSSSPSDKLESDEDEEEDELEEEDEHEDKEEDETEHKIEKSEDHEDN